MSDPETAAEIDAEIRALAARRAALAPGHPVQLPDDPGQFHHADNLLWQVRPASRSLEIGLFNPGLGWTVVRLSRAQIEDLKDAMALAVQDIPKHFNAASPGTPHT